MKGIKRNRGFMLLVELREWLMLVLEAGILLVVTLEYFYDREKDLKKQRKTKTVKKTSTLPTGETITEETTDSTESKG